MEVKNAEEVGLVDNNDADYDGGFHDRMFR